jgi:hypothetical protein
LHAPASAAPLTPRTQYIALERLEATYKSCHLIANICVHANTDAKQPIAVIIPHEANLRTALSGDKRPLADLCADKDVKALVQRECNAAGKKSGFKPMELLEAVILTPDEWTPESGLLTAAQKVQRKKVAEKFDAEIKVRWLVRVPSAVIDETCRRCTSVSEVVGPRLTFIQHRPNRKTESVSYECIAIHERLSEEMRIRGIRELTEERVCGWSTNVRDDLYTCAHRSAAAASAAANTLASVAGAQAARGAALLRPPLDVLALPMRLLPFMPLLVWSAFGSMVAVFLPFVTALVANVLGAGVFPPEFDSALSERKTSASDGAGTVTLHEFVPASHGNVFTSSSPIGRPSEPNVGPNVCPAHVMDPDDAFVDTDGARRYLRARR